MKNDTIIQIKINKHLTDNFATQKRGEEMTVRIYIVENVQNEASVHNRDRRERTSESWKEYTMQNTLRLREI